MNENWEAKFNDLLHEYSLLCSEHNKLKLSNERIKKYAKKLEVENKYLKLQKIAEGSHNQTSPPTSGLLISNSLSSRMLNEVIATKPARQLPLSTCSDMPAKAISPEKTPQPTPDNGIETESSTGLFEAFFVIGLKPTSLNSPPSILYEFSVNPSITPAMKSVLPSLALQHPTCKRLSLSASASDLNNIIFGQVPCKRAENCFIFTLRTNLSSEEFCIDLPNSSHEVIYFTCIVIEDLVENAGREFICKKSYVIASFIPAFEMQFEVLCSVLALKRLHRMNILQGTEQEIRLGNVEITLDGESMLEDLRKYGSIDDTTEIYLKRGGMDDLHYHFPKDLTNLDIAWLCGPLFCSIQLKDLLWLLAAFIQEKSIVFCSDNVGLVTACVLAMRALIRPLNSVSLTIPLIPEHLQELLDAPVPILAGITETDNKLYKKHQNVIWVLLDNPSDSNLQCSPLLLSEVAEFSTSILAQINPLYTFLPKERFDKEKDQNVIQIAETLRAYWKSLLQKFSLKDFKEKNLPQKALSQFEEADRKFIASLTSSQVFVNSVEWLENSLDISIL